MRPDCHLHRLWSVEDGFGFAAIGVDDVASPHMTFTRQRAIFEHAFVALSNQKINIDLMGFGVALICFSRAGLVVRFN